MGKLKSVFGIVVAAACLHAAGGVPSLLPLYSDGALAPSERARLAEETPSKIAACRAQLDETARRVQSTWRGLEDAMQAVRVTKRLEIARRLCAFASDELARGDVSGLASAERALYDLAAFMRYFRDEFALWAAYPRTDADVAPRVFDLVTDFGAATNGVTPVDAAWNKALEAVRACGGKPTILRLPAGDYLFAEKQIVPAFSCVFSGEYCRDENVRHAQVPVFGLENCIIEGASSESVRLRLGVFASQGLRLVNCRNVTVRNIQLAYVKAPFLQGRLTDVNPADASCDVAVDNGTLTPDDTAFTDKGVSDGMLCCSAFTPEGDLVIPASFMFYARRFKALGEGRYRLWFDASQPYYQHGKLKVGDTFVLPARKNLYHAASMAYCDFCNFENVWVRNSRAAALSVHRSRQSTFDRCRVFPEDGRVLSANADGLINSCGTALLRSTIRNQSDDGFNSMSRGVFVNGKAGDDTLLHDRIGRDCANEMMIVADPATGRYRGNLFAAAAGKSVPWRNGGSWQTRFTRPLPPDVQSYDSLGLGLISRAQQGRAAMNLERLKAEPDHLYTPSADGVGTLVADCTIRNMRGTGIVIQSANALIENNVLSNIWHGVHLGGLVKYREGPPPYNAIVSENRFFDVEVGLSTGYQVQNGGYARTAPIRGCLIRDNEVNDASSAAYELRNIGFSSIEGNRAKRCRTTVRRWANEELKEKDNDFK